MEQLVQCPVCTLYLHNGMSLESHLDTHPKDQVIKALCNLSASKSNYDSRSTTPLHSERSFRSRSRTPAIDDNSARWNSSHNNLDHDRYWRRTPSRTPNRTPSRTPRTTTTRATTPSELRIGDLTFENVNNNLPSNTSETFSNNTFSVKSDKTHTFIPTGPVSDFEQQYVYAIDQQEETEIKYSKSDEYDESNNTFAYNLPPPPPGLKVQALLPNTAKRNNDSLNMNVANNRDFLVPKTNNIALVKTNMGALQYITPNGKPTHVMVPAAQAFLQKAPQNNIVMTGNLASTSHTIHNKTVTTPLLSNQFSQLTSSSFIPNKSVVTQNSQIIYREMLHSIDGKPFISGVPALNGHNSMGNLAHTSSIYQNVMVVDPYGNTSCMYAPQHVIPQTTITATLNQNINTVQKNDIVDVSHNDDQNKTIIIEVGSAMPTSSMPLNSSETNVTSVGPESLSNKDIKEVERVETPGMKKGLKILSNIKVEVPVQHHKSMLNTIVDLTGPNDSEYTMTSADSLIKNDSEKATDYSQSSSNDNSNTFSVIKNIGNPLAYREAHKSDNKVECELTDSCPDLTCNEKPSISPCSELSENGDNAIDHAPLAPITKSSGARKQDKLLKMRKTDGSGSKMSWKHALRLNNVFVKKNKKVLKIKNSKFPMSSSSPEHDGDVRSASCSGLSQIYNFNVDKKEVVVPPYDVHKADDNSNPDNIDANTEEQSMDIEPVAHSSFNQTNDFDSVDVVHVKDEVNNSGDTFTLVPESSNGCGKQLTQLESIRPINVIAYSNMSDNFNEDSEHREFLDLEASTHRSKQFASMINDNYFGDNLYADYFTPDRVESFDAIRESVASNKDGHRVEGRMDGLYVWGDPSQKDNYAIPNFVNDDYKMTENSTYTLNSDGALNEVEFGGGERDVDVDGEACEQDSKLDVLSESRSDSEVVLNICADEKMPPRGELSGQESNGDMDAPWPAMYPEVLPPESYDLMARESWISDGSDIDTTEKREELLEEDLSMGKSTLRYSCAICEVRLATLKELHTHRSTAHPSTSVSTLPIEFSKELTVRTIKKEEKNEDILQGSPTDSKAGLAASLIYADLPETKLSIGEAIIKKEPRKRRDFVCPTCKEDQGNDALFHEHLKVHPLECLTCGKCFYRRANLNLHMRRHLGIRNYKCDMCEKRFLTKQKLTEHYNIHTGRTPVKCTHCAETFRRYSNMVQHRNRHHLHKKAKVRDYVCQCGEVVHSRAKLRWHRELHEERPKACLYCSDKFLHAASLTRHMLRAHNACYVAAGYRNDYVACPVCKQVYLRSTIKNHIMTHSGKRPYPCVICNKSFTTKWNLKLHRWVHMSRSSKPYKCTLCKGAFVRHAEYVSHMNSHKSVRPYTCNYCGCQFVRKYNCQRHVKEHELAKKYVCKVPDCGKSFHRSYYLTEHMRVHSGARPFSCNICGKTSSNKSNHNKHVKIHHAREPVATEA